MDEQQFKNRTKMFALHVIRSKLSALTKEGDEIVAMTVASIKTLRQRKSP